MSTGEGISDMLSQFWEKIVDHFEDYEISREKVLHKLALLFILSVGIIVRLFPVIKGYDSLIKAFDPYVQLQSAKYISDNGFISFVQWFKTDSWYPYGFAIGGELYWGVPLSAVILRWLLGLLSINLTMQQVAYLSPVIYGGLTVLVSYFLGKEAVSPRTGLFTAFFMSITPAFLSRSIAGFFDNESIGILFTVLSLYFFIKAMKRGTTSSAVFAGLSLAVLMGSWGAYRYILDLLPLATLVLILLRKVNYKLIKSYTITISIAVSAGFLVTRVLRNGFFGIEVMVPLLMIGVLVLIGIIQNLSQSLSEKQFKQMLIIGASTILVILIVILSVLLSLGIFRNISDKFWAVILPSGRSAIPIISSVSEHQPMAWGELYNNIHIMAFLIPLGIYYLMKKPSDVNILLLVYAVTTIYFSGSMIRLVLLLAPSASLISAIAIDKLLYPYALSAHGKIALTKRKLRVAKSIGRDEAIIVYVIVFLLMVTFIFHSLNTAQNLARSEMAPIITVEPGIPLTDWQESLLWLRNNAQGEGIIPNSPSVVMSWWDYGYWITNYGNATTLVDNATTNKTQIGVVGTMLMWNFTEAVKLMYKYNVKYVLINSQAGLTNLGSDLGKSIWPIRIAEDTVPRYGINESNYYSWDAEARTSIYREAFYKSVLYRLAAYDQTDGFGFLDVEYAPHKTTSGAFINCKNYPVENLAGDDGIVYFTEVFRSYGIGDDQTARQNPCVRIYEVVYPPNIAQLAAELNDIYPQV